MELHREEGIMFCISILFYELSYQYMHIYDMWHKNCQDPMYMQEDEQFTQRKIVPTNFWMIPVITELISIHYMYHQIK